MSETIGRVEGVKVRRGKESPLPSELRREWLSYREAEGLTGLSRTTLWKLVGAGKVKAAKVGRAVRINRQSLENFLQQVSGVEGRTMT
jgi:excisionase family DNA binding protein